MQENNNQSNYEWYFAKLFNLNFENASISIQ